MAYESEYSWDDIVPIDQEDGKNPLAAIAYLEPYKVAMAYLRAVMAVEEFSERALQLTEDLIMMNPAHYTVWTYRTRILFALNKDLEQELLWIEKISKKFPKNYQVWNHREVILDKHEDPVRELSYTAEMLDLDTKNYHVWAYRKWVVKRFGLWFSEMQYTDSMIDRDVRNNSAWNHRFYVFFGQNNVPEQYEVDEEILYVKNAILRAPQNASAWNYFLGLLKQTKRSITDIEDFCTSLAKLPSTVTALDIGVDTMTSAPALAVLADIYVAKLEFEKASEAWTLLSETYDPIRENYWQYKKARSLEKASIAE
ncbi:hypothetical protein V1512DRAFT_286629 [Lipomyces arxii]|uniref:uncharacterized protein n=1 Tax=Lipomyces arxii TaxID=56418 RepID=UPI0034CFABBA